VFIEKLLKARQLLNKKYANKNINSDFTRLMILVKLTEEFNDYLDGLPDKEEALKYKKKVYQVIPRGDRHADVRRRFVEVSP
jgi:hypothetical protein